MLVGIVGKVLFRHLFALAIPTNWRPGVHIDWCHHLGGAAQESAAHASDEGASASAR
jgi:hypothetical protein